MPRGGHDIPVSGTHLKGTHEVVTKGVDPTIKGAFLFTLVVEMLPIGP